jgi:rhodanese-related sulfurtransferase
MEALLAAARARLARLTPEQAFAEAQEEALLVDTRSADEQLEQGGAIPDAVGPDR